MPLSRHRRFPRSRTSVRDARAFVRQVLTDWGHTDRLDDITLCVSELATNALLHGAPPGREYCVSLTLDERSILLSVRDSGDRSLVLDGPEAGPGACSGRGLPLVREVADGMGVTRHVVGKAVWAVFRTTPSVPVPRPARRTGTAAAPSAGPEAGARG
ncbi:ATP-binding protein [Streptomyces sp. ISL-12]|uniref:ATP-binding protein n=1 Tax=Streptomyces sp. ISL-12 TaxID=2819177 RepID=UPI001BE6160F|nr:ATP-binding protein [Streptomyces sp. ISL-12]MBT2413344.1 ATP-binding protein [Streptomyces sp. ISL-12]